MKIFELIRKHFESIGLTASQSLQPKRFNVKNVILLLIFGVNSVLTGAYIALTANDFEGYVYSLFGCSTALVCLISYAYLIRRMSNIFKFITQLESTINGSKSNRSISILHRSPFIKLLISGFVKASAQIIYREMDEKLQAWFRILNIVLVQATPIGVTIPILVAGLFAYYFIDLGSDAFILPFPVW